MKLAIRYYLYNVRNSLLIAFGVVTGILLSSGLFLHFNQKENTDYSGSAGSCQETKGVQEGRRYSFPGSSIRSPSPSL